jgi:raffinose/stachyose/melibiose transport system permease protein
MSFYNVVAGRTHKYKLGSIFKYMLIAVLLVIVISPFYVALIYAFKYKHEITTGKLTWPNNPTLNNFYRVITQNEQFITGFQNSIFTSIATGLVLIVITSMAAYALARNNSKFYRSMYTFFTLGILIPFQCVMLPIYLNFYNVGLASTSIGYIISKIGLQISISILVVTSFVKTIPIDLEEAANIDGASRFKTFWKIVFPLMRPVNITQFVLNVLFCWNDYNVAIVMLRTDQSKTLPLAQIIYFNENTSELNLAFAFFIMAMLPILILYFSMQKYIVSGIMSGAVKG